MMLEEHITNLYAPQILAQVMMMMIMMMMMIKMMMTSDNSH